MNAPELRSATFRGVYLSRFSSGGAARATIARPADTGPRLTRRVDRIPRRAMLALVAELSEEARLQYARTAGWTIEGSLPLHLPIQFSSAPAGEEAHVVS